MSMDTYLLACFLDIDKAVDRVQHIKFISIRRSVPAVAEGIEGINLCNMQQYYASLLITFDLLTLIILERRY